MCRRKAVFHGYHPDGTTRMDETLFLDQPMGVHGLHDWWYGRLQEAGIAAAGALGASGCTRRGTPPDSGCSTQPGT